MSLRWRGEMELMERWRALLRGDPVDRVPVFARERLRGHSGYEPRRVLGEARVATGASWSPGMHGYDQPFTIIPPGYGQRRFEILSLQPEDGSVATIDPSVKTADDVEG